MTRRPLVVAADPDAGHDHYLAALVAPAVWAAGRPRDSAYQARVLGPWVDADRVVLGPLDRADVAVLPFTLEAVDEHAHLWEVAQRTAAEAERARRVLVVFCHGDRYIPAPGPHCVMLRTALDARAVGPLDVALPAWVIDPASVVPIVQRPYRGRTDVSFTGYAHPLGSAGRSPGPWLRFAVRTATTLARVDDLLHVPAADATRVAAILALRASRDVDFAPHLRSAMTRLDMDRPDDEIAFVEMLRDIAAHDHGLAVRGFGNYSYRLYEILASGRRPLYVDSGAVLPRADVVDWDRLLVRVPAARLPAAGRRLAATHAAVSPADWLALQGECRAAWVDALSPAGFLGHLADVVTAMVDDVGADRLDPVALAAALA